MEVTYSIQAFVLSRRHWREHDARVSVYSASHGLQSLTARALYSPRSKMAGHLEPLRLADMMVVSGKSQSYAASVSSRFLLASSSDNPEKALVAMRSFARLERFLRPGGGDQELFQAMHEFLFVLDQVDISKAYLLEQAFLWRALNLLGFAPELHHCVECDKSLQPEGLSFDIINGGLSCCVRSGNLALSLNVAKFLRLSSQGNFAFVSRLKSDPQLVEESAVLFKEFSEARL